MVLLPEISLTPQLESRFRKRFDTDIAVFHSGLTEPFRCNAWIRMSRGEASVLLGTRSAVFTPLKNPGLIILDEEHDISYQQQEGFRFSARDIAIKRAQQLRIPVVLGSATPSLESMFNVEKGRFTHLQLRRRTGKALPPAVQLLDIRKQHLAEGLSTRLIQTIKATLARDEQILLFLNRRGYAPTLTCNACGWVARCHHCDSNLVIHSRDNCLRCHHCGYQQTVPANCCQCQSEQLQPLGSGTERVEQILSRIFPDVSIARIDRDSTRRKGRLAKFISEVIDGKVNILLGTQMLAKGHHFPNVTLVGILDTDCGLFSTDFRALERLAQLIVQVSGRAGRANKPGTVVLQTRHPDHPLLRTLICSGYQGFAQDVLAERKAVGLPPFSYQALLRAESSTADGVKNANQRASFSQCYFGWHS